VPFPELSFADSPAIDPFFNANRPEDFDRAAALLDRLEVK
jgi:molybdopterin-guanine dinucleotide biosynthesis protein A